MVCIFALSFKEGEYNRQIRKNLTQSQILTLFGFRLIYFKFYLN